jgi:hypothetical protein
MASPLVIIVIVSTFATVVPLSGMLGHTRPPILLQFLFSILKLLAGFLPLLLVVCIAKLITGVMDIRHILAELLAV